MTDTKTNSTPAIPNRDWIEGHLRRLPFVEWDRYTRGEWSAEMEYVAVYGWIDREDEYKDFVLIRFWPATESFVFTTSSDEYSEEIHRRLLGDDGHNECHRVEHAFDVPNAIEEGDDAV